MKVYIVEMFGYEGGCVVSVHKTKELAVIRLTAVKDEIVKECAELSARDIARYGEDDMYEPILKMLKNAPYAEWEPKCIDLPTITEWEVEE